MSQVEHSISTMFANTPFDEDMLTDRDYFGPDWTPVLETPERFLVMWGRDNRHLHLMWLERSDGHIVSVRQVPAAEVEAVYDTHGRHVLDDERAYLEHIFQPGMAYPARLVEALKATQWNCSVMNSETDAEGWTAWFQLIRPPLRAAEVLINALVDESGQLVEWQLVEGAAQREQVLWCRSLINRQGLGHRG